MRRFTPLEALEAVVAMLFVEKTALMYGYMDLVTWQLESGI